MTTTKAPITTIPATTSLRTRRLIQNRPTRTFVPRDLSRKKEIAILQQRLRKKVLDFLVKAQALQI